MRQRRTMRDDSAIGERAARPTTQPTTVRAAHLARNLAGLRHARSLTQDALARAAACRARPSPTSNRAPAIRRSSCSSRSRTRSACRSTSCSPRRARKVRRWPAAEVAFRVKGRGVTIRDLVPEPVPDEMMEVLDFAPGAAMAGTPHLPGTREFFTCLDGAST